MTNEDILAAYERHMRAAKMSKVTIGSRLELLGRLARWLAPTSLLGASPADLEGWQQSFSHLSRASVDLYTRHTLALYRWAVATERIPVDPTGRLVAVRPRRGVPHPISDTDLRTLLTCARGGLRLAYVLAAFTGLRCGEITRLHVEHLSLKAVQPVTLVQGKGDRDRIVPLLPPVVAELTPVVQRLGRGAVVRRRDGQPFTPDQLSVTSSLFMQEVGVESTLHSLRHYFASTVAQMTKDVLLVRDLLGHSSLQTTQIYMRSSIDGAQDRLAAFSAGAGSLLAN